MNPSDKKLSNASGGQQIPATIRRYTVTKEFTFEAAHRLIHGYPGKCANNHGHSWVAQVTLSLQEISSPLLLQKNSLDQYGFVKDYGDFKPLRQWVDDNWDHATLVAEDDKLFIQWLQENKQRHFIVPHNPTSEVISRLLYQKAQEFLVTDNRCQVAEVRLKETCTSEAVYSEMPCIQTIR